jgi:hypothetical protein
MGRSSGRAVQDGARTGDLCAPAAPFPSPCCGDLAGGDELLQLAFRFQFDFQFGDVEVFGVAQFTQQDGVHQLGDALRDLAGIGFLGHFEEDDFGRNLLR